MNLAFRPAAGGSDNPPQLPGSLQLNRRLSQWLRFLPDGSIEVRSGKVEIGQGIVTALAQIAAEELDVRIERIRMVPASTAGSPNEGVTSGSLSIQNSGSALRYACAEARAIYLEAAAARLGEPAAALSIADGEIASASGARTSYAELADDALIERVATANVQPKQASRHRIVGTALPRLDLPQKIYGRARFVHDLELPGMLHARVLRPPSPAATLVSLDDARARALPGVVAVVRDGSFVGVLAESEVAALAALEALRQGAAWQEAETLPDAAALGDWLEAQPVETQLIAERGPASIAGAARTRRARYTRPYLAHASIAPSCALAQWTAAGLHVWTHSQGIFNLRTDLALALALPPESIVVEHVEGAGCYGHNGADDAAFDAALLARAAAGRPLRLQWTRADEFSWAPFGAAMSVQIEADLDAAGAILAWRHDIWSNGHVNRPGRAKLPALLAAAQLEHPFEHPIASNPPVAAGGGADRNAVPGYDLPAWRIVSHRLLAMPIRTSSLRSLGAYGNVFAIESFLDELAAERGEDPLAHRLRLLSEPRARAVLEAAAKRANWAGWRKNEGRGHGIGLARYKGSGAWCAVVAEIEAGREIRVERLVIAVDVGLAINPDGVANQIEGGAIQAASWTLKEQVRFDRWRITSNSWDDYPILRFSEVPAVEVEVLQRPLEPSAGAGEAAQGPTAAAIANAVFDALGVRVRDLPITPERIVAAAN
ncbi:MAG: molybdopterin cofactor-binding domain-containing protein [Burkholderiales bacterium]